MPFSIFAWRTCPRESLLLGMERALVYHQDIVLETTGLYFCLSVLSLVKRSLKGPGDVNAAADAVSK